jgi:hypothetical protein
VEVIDILAGNQLGIFKMGICPTIAGSEADCTLGLCAGTCDGDFKDEFQLAENPKFTWTDQPVFNGQIELTGMLLTDVNSIQDLKIIVSIDSS